MNIVCVSAITVTVSIEDMVLHSFHASGSAFRLLSHLLWCLSDVGCLFEIEASIRFGGQMLCYFTVYLCNAGYKHTDVRPCNAI